VLTSASAAGENSFAVQRKVFPREETAPVPGPQFPYPVSANSLTILRLKTAE